nr:hypothetical protein GCM10025699_66220 [Microbacterium flavescens]
MSLVAAPIAELRGSLQRVAELQQRDQLVLGAHLEGPFLAPDRRGAHHRHYLADPDPVLIDELVDAGWGTLRQVTLAPELPGASRPSTGSSPPGSPSPSGTPRPAST